MVPTETALLRCDDADDGVEEIADDEVALSAAAAACVFGLDVIYEDTVVLVAVILIGVGMIEVRVTLLEDF